MTNFMAYALAYAADGLPVLPLRPNSKEPASAHAKDDATTDVDQISRWWNHNPRYNIGARPPLGYAVLDVDPRNGGADALVTLLDGLRLPKTWTAKTGSGGWHIWLRAPGKLRGRLCPGVDIKHNTGYVVMAPSVHPCGDVYEWVDDSPIAHAPVWLLQKMRASEKTYTPTRFDIDTDTDGLVRYVAEAVPGNKDGRGVDDSLYWAACTAIDEGTFNQIRDELEAAARQLGHSQRRVDQTINSALRRNK